MCGTDLTGVTAEPAKPTIKPHPKLTTKPLGKKPTHAGKGQYVPKHTPVLTCWYCKKYFPEAKAHNAKNCKYAYMHNEKPCAKCKGLPTAFTHTTRDCRQEEFDSYKKAVVCAYCSIYVKNAPPHKTEECYYIHYHDNPTQCTLCFEWTHGASTCRLFCRGCKKMGSSPHRFDECPLKTEAKVQTKVQTKAQPKPHKAQPKFQPEVRPELEKFPFPSEDCEDAAEVHEYLENRYTDVDFSEL
jgi:hypothetical protein